VTVGTRLLALALAVAGAAAFWLGGELLAVVGGVLVVFALPVALLPDPRGSEVGVGDHGGPFGGHCGSGDADA
jgi:hypothetical protein